MNVRLLLLCTALAGAGPVACAGQKIEPQVATSATQTHYALDYPAALQDVSNDYVNGEGDVRRITTDFPKYPDQLKDPPWPLVQNIVDRADEAGRSASYVEARRDLEGAQTFFSQEREEITRRVVGAAQYAIKKKECDVEVAGPISGSLKEGVEKQLEKRLRAHNDAHLLIERYRESLGRANAAALEKQADEISRASYLANIRTVELKARAARLLDEASQVKRTLDRAVADERSFQAEAGRTAGDKKASSDRVAKMEEGKARIDRSIPQLEALQKEIDQRSETVKKEYAGAFDSLKKTLSAKSSSK